MGSSPSLGTTPSSVSGPRWRNWYTRTFEGRMRQLIRVQVPAWAPIPFIDRCAARLPRAAFDFASPLRRLAAKFAPLRHQGLGWRAAPPSSHPSATMGWNRPAQPRIHMRSSRLGQRPCHARADAQAVLNMAEPQGRTSPLRVPCRAGAVSSAGQSASFTPRRSGVRAPHRPL